MNDVERPAVGLPIALALRQDDHDTGLVHACRLQRGGIVEPASQLDDEGVVLQVGRQPVGEVFRDHQRLHARPACVRARL